jgi:hypothetical protein
MMKTLCRLALVMMIGLVLPVNGQFSKAQLLSSQTAGKTQNGATMHASGPFEVKLAPQTAEEKTNDPLIGRMLIDKHYHGELEAAGTGQMLTGGDYKTGSAGYVAMEKVSGTLQGRAGTFMLQHSGTLTAGAQQLSITIVPGTGTGQLTGIAGKMDVKIKEGGKHFYELDYTLPAAQ